MKYEQLQCKTDSHWPESEDKLESGQNDQARLGNVRHNDLGYISVKFVWHRPGAQRVT
jgi:hypothetical protein